MKRDVLLYPAIAAGIVSSYAMYMIVPADAAAGDLYRILFIHVPVAWIAYLSFIVSFIASILFLRGRNPVHDATAEAAAIIGLVFGAVALVTGAIWAAAAWGSPWNWDPRETTTLILWIAYLGYLSLRFSMGESTRRNTIAAVYNVLAFATVPVSYLSITITPTLHPQIVTQGGISLSPVMTGTLVLGVAAATLLYAYLLGTAVTIRKMEEEIDRRLACIPGEGAVP